MPTHAAFLRAVNLGGRRRVASEELRTAFEALGFEDVSTFRASGNVVFEGRGSEAKHRAAIERVLAERLGFDVPVFLRSIAQLRAISASQPFETERIRATSGKLQVALLAREPSVRTRGEVLAQATDRDVLGFGPRALFWLPSGGTQRSELNLRQLEQLVGPWTMRTLDTIEQIIRRYFA
jgi:uncharacterized protein (DUF1697 family)